MNNMKDFWILVIPLGEDNAIHQKDLAARLGMQADTLKREIREARNRGIEICSTINGYFFPKDELERRRFVDMQRKQAISRLKTSRVCQKALKDCENQKNDDSKKGEPENG